MGFSCSSETGLIETAHAEFAAAPIFEKVIPKSFFWAALQTSQS